MTADNGPDSASNETGDRRALDSQAFFLMTRASTVGAKASNNALKPLQMNIRHFAALSLSADNGPLVTQREMASYLALDPSRVVSIVDELERRKLVERRPDPRDRRSKVVVATQAGREAFSQGQELTLRATQKTLGQLTSEQRATLLELLRMAAFPAEE